MSLSGGDPHGKVVVDSIHGDIHLKDREVRVIDTASFQRLRQLKQLAMAHYVYPNATHNRFAHSIGTLGIMSRVLALRETSRIELSPRQCENLRLAALLHDIGHYPYSHLMEKVDRVTLTEEHINGVKLPSKALDAETRKYPSHEELGALIVTRQDDLIEAVGGEERAQEVADLFSGRGTSDPQLSKLIRSSLDLDRLDYLLRDSHATGVPYGHVDVNYLLNSLRISSQGTLGFADKALVAVEHLLLARFFMHRTVYYHKTTYGMEEACRQLLRRLRDRTDSAKRYGIPANGDAVEDIVTSAGLSRFSDAFIDSIIQKAADDEDRVIRALARSILSRRPPALLKEVQVCEGQKDDHAGITFKQNCNSKISQLATNYSIPLEQFILCETKSLTIGEYPRKFTLEEIDRLSSSERSSIASEEQEKDIKVFMEDDDEPKSLTEINHTLVAKNTDYCFKIFRLYVVYEGSDKDDKIARLRAKVNNWDKG